MIWKVPLGLLAFGFFAACMAVVGFFFGTVMVLTEITFL